jgi:hypothetical protein
LHRPTGRRAADAVLAPVVDRAWHDCAIDIAWVGLDDKISIDPWSLLPVGPAVVFAPLLALCCRVRPEARLHRLYTLTTGALFICIGFIVLRIFNHLTMSLPFPLADDLLAGLDARLGFDWLAYARWVAERPWIVALFNVSYTGLTTVALLVFAALVAAGHGERAEVFVRLLFWTGLAAIVIGTTLPGQAALDRYATADLIATFGPDAGVYHLPYIEALRSAAPHVLDLNALPGLVVLPSFHTACGLLIVYACRRIPVFAPLSAIYAAVMIASTPIMGGHYFVDLIGAAALTPAVIALEARLSRTRWSKGSQRSTKTAAAAAAG